MRESPLWEWMSMKPGEKARPQASMISSASAGSVLPT